MFFARARGAPAAVRHRRSQREVTPVPTRRVSPNKRDKTFRGPRKGFAYCSISSAKIVTKPRAKVEEEEDPVPQLRRAGGREVRNEGRKAEETGAATGVEAGLEGVLSTLISDLERSPAAEHGRWLLHRDLIPLQRVYLQATSVWIERQPWGVRLPTQAEERWLWYALRKADGWVWHSSERIDGEG